MSYPSYLGKYASDMAMKLELSRWPDRGHEALLTESGVAP